MSAYFVTATGTDIGKTFVTAGLVRALRAQGRAAGAVKPIVSGFDMMNPAGSDPAVLLAAMGEPVTQEALAGVAPWRFAAPLSPDMAAAREGRAIGFDELLAFCRNAIAAREGTLFVEGVGGIMVPLDGGHTVLDWAGALGLPLIVVAGSYLGTLSHTLTALAVIARAKLTVAALVVNETGDSAVPLAETVATLRRFSRLPVISLPRIKDSVAPPDMFAELAALI
ncbi:MAG: dethiobiotin synthase [Rhizomicrobium sp.]